MSVRGLKNDEKHTKQPKQTMLWLRLDYFYSWKGDSLGNTDLCDCDKAFSTMTCLKMAIQNVLRNLHMVRDTYS